MNTPLVSVVVITYNSSKYVLETLESAKAQTYQNIELVVSDDCSTDNTVELCRNWIEQNKTRFVRTELILSEKNTGISANCNRGYKAAQGEWIKGIAGDDILMDECIQYYIDRTRDNTFDLAYSKLKVFGSIDTDNIQKLYDSFFDRISLVYAKSQEECCRLTRYMNNFPAPSMFINRKIFETIGYFDERIPFIEDWPWIIKVIEHKPKFRIAFFNTFCVKYRQEESISRCRGERIVNPKFFDSYKKIYDLYLFRRYKEHNEFTRLVSSKIKLFRLNVAIKLFNNRKSLICSLFLKPFRLIDPALYCDLSK